ncbi:MAG: DUF4845 domain-containing protein [Thiomargarita sp.]|nr:DUF4845 domain-containing protein [Thiomargarita sp.]
MLKARYQRGMTGVSLMLSIIVFIFALLIFFKLLPIYMENFQLVNAIENIEEDYKVASQIDSDLRNIILKGLSEQNIDLFTPENIRKYVTIERNSSENTVELTVIYTREKTFFGNVFFLVKFEEYIILH